MSILLKLQRITAPVIIFGGAAYIIVEKSFIEGVGYLIISFVLYLFITVLEYLWIEHKHDRRIR